VLFLFLPALVFSQAGDGAVAARYSDYAERLIDGNKLAEAEAVLERAHDYADGLSDLSFRLAFVRMGLGRPAPQIIEAAETAIAADRWRKWRAEDARLVLAKMLIRTKQYPHALRTLALCSESAENAVLRLEAFRGLRDAPAFLREAAAAFDRYPRETRIPRLALRYASGGYAGGAPYGGVPASGVPASGASAAEDFASLIDRILKILPLLTEISPELAYLAAPFVYDVDAAKLLVLSYRAASFSTGKPDAESLPISQQLGVIDDAVAVDELFSTGALSADGMSDGPFVDRALLNAVWNGLKDDAGREAFAAKLQAFSGRIGTDEDGDAYFEAVASYEKGGIMTFTYDAGQDGVLDFSAVWNGGQPARGLLSGNATLTSNRAFESTGGVNSSSASGTAGDRPLSVDWQVFPGVASASIGDISYEFAPRTLFYSPFRLEEAVAGINQYTHGGAGTILYPVKDSFAANMTERTLAAFAISLSRPSADFAGREEKVTLLNGIPLAAEVRDGGRTLSRTEFVNGAPALQTLDFDGNGTMETVRRYEIAHETSGGPTVFLEEESDFDD
jgi:hypothetical protein